jgi:hypothetical protein
MCALWRTPYAGPWKGQGAAEIGKTGGAICGTGAGASCVLGPCGTFPRFGLSCNTEFETLK